MNKEQLVVEVSVRADLSRRIATEALDAVFASIGRALRRGEKVVVPGFGTFERRLRGPRVARNPRTGERVVVPAASVVVFRPGRDLKRNVGRAMPTP